MPISAQIEIVAIDDDPRMLDFIEAVLARPGLNISKFSDPREGWERIRRIRPEIAILDQIMPAMNGMELLARIVECDPAIDVVILSGEYSTERAVEAIQKGACDYLTKPISAEALRDRIDLLIAVTQKKRRAGLLERELLDVSKFDEMIGRSDGMLDVFALVRRVAPHFRSVLVTGATGTGKELVARALHRMSPVAEKTVRRLQLRGDCGDASGERAVRAHPGIVYGGVAGPCGVLRGGRRGDAFSG